VVTSDDRFRLWVRVDFQVLDTGSVFILVMGACRLDAPDMDNKTVYYFVTPGD